MPGGEDLTATGSWAEAPEYGAVWYPPVAADWVPYREGHWAYVSPWGWTWIDNASWGFAPFHYGRWVEIGNRWGWTPGTAQVSRPPVYAPALVTFLGIAGGAAVGAAIASRSVSWVPLGPGEAYHPWYRASDNYRRQVNVAHVSNVTTVNNTNVTVNTFINRNAATAVPASAMAASQPVAPLAQPVSPQQFSSARPVFGQQPIQPTAATAGVTPVVARQMNLPPGASAFRPAPGPVARAQAPGPAGSVGPAAAGIPNPGNPGIARPQAISPGPQPPSAQRAGVPVTPPLMTPGFRAAGAPPPPGAPPSPGAPLPPGAGARAAEAGRPFPPSVARPEIARPELARPDTAVPVRGSFRAAAFVSACASQCRGLNATSVAPAAPPQRVEPPAPRFASPQQRFEPPAAQIPPPQRFEPPLSALGRPCSVSNRLPRASSRPCNAWKRLLSVPSRLPRMSPCRRNGWKRLHRALLRLWSALSRRHGSKRLRLVPRRRSSQPPRRRRIPPHRRRHILPPRLRRTRNGQTNGEAAQSPVQLARHADCRAPRWRAARTAQCARCLACWLLGHSGNRWPRGPSTGRLAGRSPGPRLRRDAPKPGPSRWHQRCGGAASWARWRCGRAL